MTTKSEEHVTDKDATPIGQGIDAAMGTEASPFHSEAKDKNHKQLQERVKEGMKDAAGELPEDQV